MFWLCPSWERLGAIEGEGMKDWFSSEETAEGAWLVDNNSL